MILFGGFHEALRTETRWFNDVHIYDFQTSTWTELQYGKLARLPPPRSACNMALCTSPSEALFIYGGYSKLKNPNLVTAGGNAPGGNKSEGILHVDCWMLPLKALLNAGKGSGGGGGVLGGGASPPPWERITRKGEYPSPRAGTSAVMHKNKLLVFGGVLDNEGDHHRMESVFYDDLFAFDMERRRWFAMRLKKGSGGGKRRRKKKSDFENGEEGETEGIETDHSESDSNDECVEELGEEGKNDVEVISSGWDLDKLRHDMFAFIDGNGNIVYEKIDEDMSENDVNSLEKIVKDEISSASETVNPTVKAINSVNKSNQRSHENDRLEVEQKKSNLFKAELPTITKQNENISASAVMNINHKGLPKAVTRQSPLPRINCATAIRANTFYVYGGVLEVGDREVTLDDCWSIDLNKR